MARVVPEPTHVSDIPNYTNCEENTAFIIIYGVGTKDLDLCLKVGSNYYEQVSYNSQGV